MKDLKQIVGMNYDDVLSSDKQVKVIRGRTRASKKSNTAALMCINEAMKGKNVLCVRRKSETIADSIFNSCVWAIKALDLSDEFSIDTPHMEIRGKNSRISFMSWNQVETRFILKNHIIPAITSPVDLVWWEDANQYTEAEIVKAMSSEGLSNSKHIFTSIIFDSSPDWIKNIQSNDKLDVFDKDYTDNEFLSEEDKVFLDKTYSKKTGDIGWARNKLIEGKFVARKGWNGKGMFLWMLPAQELKMEWLHDEVKKTLAERNGGTVFANATICLYNAQHQITTGWSPWLEDFLATDWIEVFPLEE